MKAAAPQNICSDWINHKFQGAAHRNLTVRCTLKRLHPEILQRFRSAAALSAT
jgi:hypothetical protein